MDANVLLNYTNEESLLQDYPGDGLIIYTLADTEERELVKKHITKFTPEVIVCLSDADYDFDGQLRKVLAIQHIKKNALANDSHYLEEIEYFEEDISKQIKRGIERSFSPISRHSKYYNSRGKLDVFRQTDINHIVAGICMERYFKTPAINNEMVNKNNLNAQNLKGRNIVVDWVLQHAEDAEITCMDGYGPEVSIFKSMYVHTGLSKSEKANDNAINEVLSLIKKFVDSSEQNIRSFSELYDILAYPPYGIRKGIIPLFIAYVLRHYSEILIIYFKEKEMELNASILSSINDNPGDYSILLEAGTAEREEYLETLENLFASYEDAAYSGTNRALAVVKNMQTWMRSLPEYTKRFSFYYRNGELVKIDNCIKIVRDDLLKFGINAREMLFDSWRKKLSADDEYIDCAAEIRRIKEFLDMHIADFRRELTDYLVALFLPGYSGTLSKAIKIWYERLPESTKRHFFDRDANSLLQLANNWDLYDDQRLLNELSMLVVSMGIEDWTDQLADRFKRNLESVLERINSFAEVDEERSECRLIIDLPGISVEKSFTDSEISPLGRTALCNLKAIFDEYNDAFGPDEQLAIIAQLVKDIVH